MRPVVILQRVAEEYRAALDAVSPPASSGDPERPETNLPTTRRVAVYTGVSGMVLAFDPVAIVALAGSETAFLEAGCVVLVGLTDLDDSESSKLLYVGGSRARAILRVLLPTSCSAQIQGRLLGVLQALSADRNSEARGLF